MNARPRFTLIQAFVAATLTLGVLAAAMLYALMASSQRSILASAERLRDTAAQRMEARIEGDLGEAEDALASVERAIRLGAAHADSPDALEPALFSELADRPSLAEITFTRADSRGFGGEGQMRVAENRWQLCVFRGSADPASALDTRVITKDGDTPFTSALRSRAPGAPLQAPLRIEGNAPDPTAHATFETTASQAFYGQVLWSDLHFSELDAQRPPSERRVVVTVQKAIEDAAGDFLGVLRVGIRTQTLDEVAHSRVNEADDADPHRIFVCDARGRLVTRLAPADRLEDADGDLRVTSAAIPYAIARALASPRLREVTADAPRASDAFVVDDRRTLVTFRALARTQDWIVGIVVPEDYYTRDLRSLRDRALFACASVGLLALIAGGFALRALRRSFGRVARTTARMRDLDFTASADAEHAAFRDVDDVMDGLERAKTAVRALGKYVPLDLVRTLYAKNEEPRLGGELRDVTLMFTDIRGFTGLAERLTPDALAEALGHYLEAMTNAIRTSGGTIDKYIGDAVMALWNAPSRCEDAAKRACLAALACIEATEALYASPSWSGLPPLFTRFGLHKDDVLVGHFGAPTRLSYTALGDGVNLAARLESLCKQYGVAILVSEAIEVEARGVFAFRLVDRVAVKGKTKPVRVYELLGAIDRVPSSKANIARTYEQALEAYFEQRFADAQALLAPQRGDGPSGVLYARCDELRAQPARPGWDGVYVAATK